MTSMITKTSRLVLELLLLMRLNTTQMITRNVDLSGSQQRDEVVAQCLSTPWNLTLTSSPKHSQHFRLTKVRTEILSRVTLGMATHFP